MNGALATTRFTLTIGPARGSLDVGDHPCFELDGVRHAITRRMVRSGGWGYTDYQYTVHGPDGITASGGGSLHDGVGVSLPGGRSWSLDRHTDDVFSLGDSTRITVDRVAGEIVVETAEAADRIPHIVCGVLLLVDPQFDLRR